MVTPAKPTFHLLNLEHSWVDDDGKRLTTILHLIISVRMLAAKNPQ